MRAELAGRPLLLASIALIGGVSAVSHSVNLLVLPLLLWLVEGTIGWTAAARLLRTIVGRPGTGSAEAESFRSKATFKIAPALWVTGAFLVGLIIAPGDLQPVAAKGVWCGIGTVANLPTLKFGSESFLLETDDGMYQVLSRTERPVKMGETLSVIGHALAPNGQSEERFDRSGIDGVVRSEPEGITVLDRGPIWFQAANAMRDSFSSSVERALPYQQASIVNALVIASSGSLPAGTRNDLSRTGAAYILSASGLQVLLLAFMLQSLLCLLPIRREWQILATVVILALYATVTGLHAATIRTVLMASVAMAAYLFRREPDFLSALGLAAILTVLWQPWSIYSPGFQLSYITVGALSLYWKSHVEKTGSRIWDLEINRLWFVVRLSFIATLAAAPLTAYHFGVVSLISPISSLLIGPVVPVLVLVAIAGWAFGLLVPALQIGLLKLIAGPLASWVALVGEILGRQAWSAIPWPQFNAYWLVVYYGGFLLVRGSLATRGSRPT